jgi:hypothetical protein
MSAREADGAEAAGHADADLRRGKETFSVSSRSSCSVPLHAKGIV